MRPKDLHTKIFLDSGDPGETKEVLNLLGFLDGQTTNPTLISKSPEAQERLSKGEKFTKDEILEFYKKTVTEISHLIPEGSVSIEVYADHSTTAEEMLAQGKEMFSWIPNAHIKFPTTKEGLQAAQHAVKEGLRINMTLCFSQEQAAAVYDATLGAKKGQVFVSPFDGRLDDRGDSGISLVENIVNMYKNGDGHVEVLAASIRDVNHICYFNKAGTDIITVPFSVLRNWYEVGCPITIEDSDSTSGLKTIPYKEIGLNQPWTSYDISHDLTDKGIVKFSDDWNKLIKRR